MATKILLRTPALLPVMGTGQSLQAQEPSQTMTGPQAQSSGAGNQLKADSASGIMSGGVAPKKLKADQPKAQAHRSGSSDLKRNQANNPEDCPAAVDPSKATNPRLRREQLGFQATVRASFRDIRPG